MNNRVFTLFVRQTSISTRALAIICYKYIFCLHNILDLVIRYLVPNRAKILFVGINPHFGSYAKGVPFSNNKTFWYNLSKAGIIKEPVSLLKSDKELKRFYYTKFEKYGLGFTNLVDRPSRDVSQLIKGEEGKGVRRLCQIVKRKKPKIVCFIGRITYQKFTGANNFKFGFQKQKLFDSKVFVARFPIRGPSAIRIRELRKINRETGRYA